MRVVVYGVGAIGGTLAAALADAGFPVIGIARGRQLDAIRKDGLTLRSPDRVIHARFDCVAAPSDIDFAPDDAILLTMKSQDTMAALQDLRAAGVDNQPIFCAQNGVANEAMAARIFPNVHGICVMMPSSFVEPGQVVCSATPKLGMFDIGRYPSGHDHADTALATALDAAGVKSFVQDCVMDSKYGKLLLNLNNIIDAALGAGVATGDLSDRIRDEGRQVLRAAGIPWREVGGSDPRRKEFVQQRPVDGAARVGTSTSQSLARGTGSVETDFLNGEIALIARQAGIAAPMNAAAQRLSARLVRDGAQPGAMSLAALTGLLTAE
ncbi:ketopantoate reductase family protein [Pseudooceanicola aestuarii]|uniref:ketopantoate reductase family protein n=1 Tax=Pseudooceanicola aestuarii TaxID=2697319 RepID=UPI0013D51A46|nr:ketopantoate reductase family protein [Pseudooceanicola aestuarii]